MAVNRCSDNPCCGDQARCTHINWPRRESKDSHEELLEKENEQLRQKIKRLEKQLSDSSWSSEQLRELQESERRNWWV